MGVRASRRLKNIETRIQSRERERKKEDRRFDWIYSRRKDSEERWYRKIANDKSGKSQGREKNSRKRETEKAEEEGRKGCVEGGEKKKGASRVCIFFFIHLTITHRSCSLQAVSTERTRGEGQVWITRMWHFLAMKKSMSH